MGIHRFLRPSLAIHAGGDLFVKRARAASDCAYPDFGCSVEIFTNAAMLELETLGPLATVEPGASLKHIEEWSLRHVPDLTRTSDDELAEIFGSIRAKT